MIWEKIAKRFLGHVLAGEKEEYSLMLDQEVFLYFRSQAVIGKPHVTTQLDLYQNKSVCILNTVYRDKLVLLELQWSHTPDTIFLIKFNDYGLIGTIKVFYS